MSHVIGIDLGTTNSCVAVPDSAEMPGKEELIARKRLVPAGGALVITDPRGAYTTPSAVWASQDGTVEVGVRAKQMARLADVPPPALFFKRAMGSDTEVTAGYRTMTPEEASGHVLMHMKGIAEAVLGVPVERAIVTVPAFFENKAKNLTTEAGERAGLEVVETLLEPVAAALMYTSTRQLIDPMTFMVYDLGGGTFDNSIVTWDPDVGFENRSFDGNQYLGGYDFDWKIVKWMISQLDGYDLALDRDDPRDHAILYRLLPLAEKAKHDLARDVEALISETTLTDRTGNQMNIHLWLSREEFETMIADDVLGTMDSCDRAMEKARVDADDLSELVMVGGSSKIPLVRRLLSERFHREPLVIDPDLCVAVGAALKASTIATRSSYLTVDRPPTATSLPSIDITGQILCGIELPEIAGVTLLITSDDGAISRSEVSNADGGFLFEDIELHPNAENGFTVQVMIGGEVIDRQRLMVTHAEDAATGNAVPEGDILAHDFSVAIADGLHRVAKAGTKLPYRTSTVSLETATQRGEVSVEFYEENRPVGTVRIRELPRDLAIGSAVLVDLEFEKGWTVSASVKIPAAGASAAAYAAIELPKMAVPSWEELRRRCRQAKADLESMQGVTPAAQLLEVGPEIDANLRKVDELVSEKHDAIHALHALSEAETLLKGLRTSETDTLQPPLSEFESAVDELARLVSRLEDVDPSRGAEFRSRVEPLRDMGVAAFQSGNPVDWNTANETVRRRIGVVRTELGDDDSSPPPAPIVQLMLAQELRQVIDTLRQAQRYSRGNDDGRFGELLSEAEAVADAVNVVNVADEKGASARLMHLYHTQVLPLRARAERLMKDIFGQEESGPGSDLRLPGSSVSGPDGRSE